MSKVAVSCSTCGASLLADAGFCEECGARVDASPGESETTAGVCGHCGAPAATDTLDGYCPVCGVRSPVVSRRTEQNLGPAAALSDNGLVHRRNDDAFYLEAAGTNVVAIVCDGVSTSISADVAARRAARAAGFRLADTLRENGRDPRAGLADSMTAAHRAVEQLGPAPRGDLADPACTLVAAVCRDGELFVGWLGDSRAYWLSPNEELQLTIDNSWAAEQLAAGMPPESAAADPRARSITRWVGADAPEGLPQIVVHRPAERGLLVLCSDGLWSYSERPSDLARLVRQLPPAASPLAISRWLADAALEAGGNDNITAAVVDVRLDGRRTR